MKEEYLIDHVGLTSHGDPSLIRTAIERIPELETVTFPFDYVLAGKEGAEYDYDSVLDLAERKGLGTLCIKGFAKGLWPEDLPDEERPDETWYEPFDTEEELIECLRFSLPRHDLDPERGRSRVDPDDCRRRSELRTHE